MKEKSVKLNLLDENENVLCSLEGLLTYDEINPEDEGDLTFQHPMTGSYEETADRCLQGFSEMDELDNIHWSKLVEQINNDGDLLTKAYDLEEVNYFI